MTVQVLMNLRDFVGIEIGHWISYQKIKIPSLLNLIPNISYRLQFKDRLCQGQRLHCADVIRNPPPYPVRCREIDLSRRHLG